MKLLITLSWGNHIIDLQHHLADLRGQEQLLLLAAERLEYVLLLHVVGAQILAVDAKVRIAF